MNVSSDKRQSHALPQRLLPVMLAFMATLAGSPGHAVTIPHLPLQTGTAYPSPNIMFILDNSGSMGLISMPFDVQDPLYTGTATGASRTGLRDDPTDRSYLNNTIYYDPDTDYRPWMTSDGTTRMSGGQDVSAVYASWSLADGADFGCNRWGGNCVSGTRDLRGSDESVFYVPRDGVTGSTRTSDFVRYRVNASGRVVTLGGASRSQAAGFPKGPLAWNMNAGTQRTFSIVVPAGTTSLEVSTAGGGNGVELNLLRPGGNTECSSSNGNNKESCSDGNPVAGTWTVQVYRDNRAQFTNVELDAYLTTASEVEQTPTGRSQADELRNIATWYSYYRSRMKTAKGGAAEAFSSLGSALRVGFTAINGRAPGLTNSDDEVIPVSTDGGLFKGANRTGWFSELLGAETRDGATPLRGALRDVGEYYTRSDSKGPWGPDQLSCRQSFSILTTDGYWNGNAPDIGDADGTDGDSITSKDGKSVYKYTPVSPYKDNFSGSTSTRGNTLADIAMHYWKRDLVTLANDVPTSMADPAFWQHMVTFGVSIGLQGRLNPKTDFQAISNGTKRWGDPTDREDLDRIDDLWHASVNGHGNFVTASNPKQFAQGLVEALATVAARMGSASNVTANSTSFQSDTRVYQASYVSGKWIGELAAYEVSSAGVSKVDADGDGNPDPVWQASKQIPAGSRNAIWTRGSTGGTGFPTATQRAALEQGSRALAPATADQNVAYLKGASTLERRNGGKLRDRDTVLGDIANSSPMFVNDSQTIFVGANDGMLHAFNALTGAERFAYVPSGIDFAQLATLSDPQYVHRYFVDGPIVVTTTRQTPGRNYLVGALGRGGKGVFGLDVSAPATFGNDSVLWDKTGADAPANMGQVLGDPLVVNLNDGTRGVIVSNGINSNTGTASLFILDLDTGAVIKELDTGAIGDNGLSAPRGADLDGNGTVDYVYAGDLRGNLWKFDLAGTVDDTWAVAHGGAPMFVARDADDKRQPITAGVALARNPASGKTWVFIGTGSFMTSHDVANNDVQSMYGVIDDGSVVTGRTSSGDGDLAKREIVVVTTKDGRAVRGFEQNAGTLASDRKGWYIDMDNPEAGERIVSNPRIRGTVLLTSSLIPPTTNTCDAGGTGYINALDAFTGTSVKQPYFDSNGDGFYDDKDKIKDEQGNDLPIGSIDLGVGMPTLPTIIDQLLVVGGSKGNLGSVPVNPQGGAARRISWRELVGN